MPVVHRIEPNQRSEQPPVSLGQVFPGQIAALAQVLFQAVQLGKHFIKRLLVSLLRGGKACAVHAIVDCRVDPLVQRINFGL
ncbi:hypothetical protein D3C77_496530 [compost metagenome]